VDIEEGTEAHAGSQPESARSTSVDTFREHRVLLVIPVVLLLLGLLVYDCAPLMRDHAAAAKDVIELSNDRTFPQLAAALKAKGYTVQTHADMPAYPQGTAYVFFRVPRILAAWRSVAQLVPALGMRTWIPFVCTIRYRMDGGIIKIEGRPT
jgi:hypothetical protein